MKRIVGYMERLLTIHRKNGFTLPTLLIISTVLMAMGAAILQGTLSVKNSLDDQYYDQIAREAAESGVRFAQSCITSNSTWTQLRPDTTCTGAANGVASAYVLNTPTYRTTFTVGSLDVRADGSTLAIAKGKTELLRRGSGSVYRSYNETVGQAVGATSMMVIPTEMQTGGSANDDTMSYLRGYDGNVYGMGSNGSGRLGDGTTTNRNTPVRFQLPSGLSAKKMSAAYNFAAVLASDGQVYVAGDNRDGQFGVGNTNDYSTPVRYPLPAGIFATDVIAGGGGAGYNIYILASNGRVYGSGSNGDGQLTGTNTANQTTPKLLPLPAGVSRVRKITFPSITNDTLSLVILGNNGTAWGVGSNDDMQLGNSDRTSKTSFIQFTVPSSLRVIDISTGYHGTFLTAANSQVYGYGQGDVGQLGNGSTTMWQSAAQQFDLPAGLTAQKIYPASSSNVPNTGNNERSSTYVLASDHQVYGAGQNHNGQLGDGSTTNRSTAVRFNLPGALTAQEVETKYFTTCVLASDKQVYCAGRNQFGQIGNNNTTNQTTPQKFPLPAGVAATNVRVSFSEVYVTGSDGNIYAAGRNNVGQLGVGNLTNQDTPTVVVRPIVPLNRTPVSASLSYIGTRVLASDGNVYSVGRNLNGEFGAGVVSDPQIIPLQFQLPGGFAKRVEAGFYDTQVLSSNGHLYGAGRNRYHQLAYNANTADQYIPVKYGTSTNTIRDFKVSTSEGNDTTLVFLADNYVHGTGLNGQGQLGNGNTNINSSAFSTGKFVLPAGVRAMKMWFGDGGSNNVTFVLGTNEKVYAAGRNDSGQIGDGNTTNPVATPVQVNLPAGCYTEDMDVGTDVSFHLCKNGDVYAMGKNFNGQIGDNTTTQRTSPTKVLLPSGVTGVKLIIPRGSTASGGYAHVLASDGNVYGWGANGFGQLGDGSTTQRNAPVRFNLPAGVSAVDGWQGQNAVFVLGSNGNIYAAGANFQGQLGVGDMNNKSSPTRVNLPSGVVGVSVSAQYAYYSQSTSSTPDHFSGFFGSDGKLYMAGYNGHGQLGDGTTNTRTNPVEFVLPQPAGGGAGNPIIF